jgi:alpha-glucosidase (family GH31 glycosyl hydrolase)
VYLPQGEWVDFWDRGRVVTGPVELTEDVPLGELSLFVEQGSPLLSIPAP